MTATREYVDSFNLSSELASFGNPANQPEVGPTVKVDDHYPESDQLPQLKNLNGKPALITFLRHCGCPFAEKAFHQFRELSDQHPEVQFIAVSHSTQTDTDEWIISVGGTGDVDVVVDPERTLYAKWGLGFSSYWANLGPVAIWKALKLGQEELIYNRPTKSGYRWQTAGSFAIDGEGQVKWAYTSKNSPDVPNFLDGLKAVGIDLKAKRKPKDGDDHKPDPGP